MKKSFLLIVIAGLMWGTSGVFVTYLTPYGFSSLQITAVRALVAVIGMLTYTVITARGFCSRCSEW